ncbi:PAS domain-containing protein [Paradesertivirga mongoliensis]|uniref:PAS domain-containing protein n=1 Tax=Paradesertivirga mongoliensis TaxID=2100740 RepID=A0ABW4ZNA7_9SPHI|nr:PAS domain S-box protein [Pedobacter mongoliensis]
MIIPLTPRILGYLIEKGYTYVLAASTEHPDEGTVTITLFPVKDRPESGNLPRGYEVYYQITQEPMQMSCGIDNTTTVVIDLPENESMPDLESDEVLDDNYFRMSEDFYRQVLESLEDYAVFTTDQMGDVNSWNKGAERVLGYSEREVIGQNARIFFTEKDQEAKEPEKELQNALKHGKGIDERFHVRKDGSVFWGSGLVFPLYDTKKSHRGFTKIMRNLEEQRESKGHAPKTRI